MKVITRALVAGCAVAAAVWSLGGLHREAPAMAAVAGESPGYAVEDFSYPGADKVLAERGIVLKRGDGHIMLAECSGDPAMLEVWSRLFKKTFCFKVTGDTGYLELEIPQVFTIKGNDYSTKVEMTSGDERKTFDIEKGNWTSVGEITDPENREFALVEIRTSK
ncbi:hypothetical protein ACFU6R_24225 [Streptomyces sp. NPDC057499]|uniref:hypothetical protein n=1 Tax=Streptomyces sp. NPDC057499 TaxID=3346150 RepID=UPI00367B3F56